MKHKLESSISKGIIKAVSVAMMLFFMGPGSGMSAFAEGEIEGSPEPVASETAEDPAASTDTAAQPGATVEKAGEEPEITVSEEASSSGDSTSNGQTEQDTPKAPASDKSPEPTAEASPEVTSKESPESDDAAGSEDAITLTVKSATPTPTPTPEPTPTPVPDPTPATWEYSKSKTATNLDKDYQSDVSLTLPSAEQQLTTEICFVLDGSSYSKTSESALKLLSSLKDAVAESGAKVQVDIVGFKRIAYDDGSYDLATQYDEIARAFQQKHSGGTNMHAGLLLAKEVLARDTSIPDSRKYMILVSDGDTYLYCKNGDYTTPYSRSFIPVANARGTAYGGFYDESWYYPSAPYGTNVGRPKTNDVTAWDSYLKDVADRNAESNGNSYEYVWNYYDHNWQSMTPDQVSADGFKTMPTGNAPTGKNTRQASNMDMAYLYAASTYSELAQKYNCCALQAQSLNTADGGKSAFMGYLNNVGNGGTVDFRTIQNEIVYYLDAGSTVEDYMGYSDGNYNFDLDDPKSMVIAVKGADGNQKTYDAVKIGENKYGFKPAADSGKDTIYSYIVEYFPGDQQETEHLVWIINVPVTNFEHVSLNYKVKLINPKTKPGNYGQYDANGSQNYDGLYTNGKAVLNPIDSKGQAGAPEEFAKPTVSYTVSSTPTPSPTPTATPTATPSATPAPTSSPTAKPTPTASAKPSVKVTTAAPAKNLVPITADAIHAGRNSITLAGSIFCAVLAAIILKRH